MHQDLSDDEKMLLLDLARTTIVDYICNSSVPQPEITNKNLLSQRGCFVTIKQNESLRGCIGSFVSDKPLFALVQDMAISAATRDPRFYPMKKNDLADFQLEISVLSPMRKITSIDDIVVGTHGLYIEKNFHRGVLLPQVAVEYHWDRLTFINQTCVKAGLPADAWKEGADIFIFSAEIF